MTASFLGKVKTQSLRPTLGWRNSSSAFLNTRREQHFFFAPTTTYSICSKKITRPCDVSSPPEALASTKTFPTTSDEILRSGLLTRNVNTAYICAPFCFRMNYPRVYLLCNQNHPYTRFFKISQRKRSCLQKSAFDSIMSPPCASPAPYRDSVLPAVTTKADHTGLL